jgi:peptidyl-prolyl cis-trans isomerase SurA
MHKPMASLKFISLILKSSISFLLLASGFAMAQEKVVLDEVAAVVGKNIILRSDIENQYLQYIAQSKVNNTAELKCKILEELLFQKLLVTQAEIDSVSIEDNQVESELERRLRYFINQIGSKEKLEEYYGKSILEIKEEFRPMVKEQLIIQQVQSGITKDVKVTPSEVKAYFKNIPKDSIPLINTEVEISQIVKAPKVSEAEKKAVKEKLESLRQRIMSGEKFSTMAILYSEDPGSAKNGGELGFVNRGDLVPSFEAIAFSIKEGEISEIIETEYGYHFMQLIERRADQVNVRHILMSPKPSVYDLEKARNTLDSLADLIKKGALSFEDAAVKFSDDAESRNNGGLMINPQSGTTRFEMSQVDPSLLYTIAKLEAGKISNAVKMQTNNNKDAYRLVMLKSKSDPHKANLKDDYAYIQNRATEEKQQTQIDDWIKKKISSIYIDIKSNYLNCSFMHKWSSYDDKL